MFHVSQFDLLTLGFWVWTKFANAEKRCNNKKQNSRKMFKETTSKKNESPSRCLVTRKIKTKLRFFSLSQYFVEEVAVVSHVHSWFLCVTFSQIITKMMEKKLCGLLLELTSIYLLSIITTANIHFLRSSCTFMVFECFHFDRLDLFIRWQHIIRYIYRQTAKSERPKKKSPLIMRLCERVEKNTVLCLMSRK